MVELGHHGHYHIQSVGPPPIVVLRSAHFVFHDFACTGNLVVVRQDVVEVHIRLETNLIIAEKHVFIAFAIRILPLGLVLFLGTLPLVVLGPSLGIGTIGFVAGQEIGFHVAGVIGGIVPERTHFRLVVGLPIRIHLVDDFSHFLRFRRLCREKSRRTKQHDAEHCFL